VSAGPVATPEAVFSMKALWAAAARAARGKRGRVSVARFDLRLGFELHELHRELVSRSWRPSPPTLQRVHDPKPRVISVQPFRDRVVHQCLFAVLDPRASRRLIRDTYACRPGLGTHAALRRATAWARTWPWCVHVDVARFFPSVDHAVVREQLAEDVPEPWLRALCDAILRAGECARQRWHFPGDELFTPLARDVGLPLGNLTSQVWANRYLDPIDHLVKDRLRLRGYLRYMDDMVLFHDDPHALFELARAVEGACHGLRLRLHPWQVRPTAMGLAFVGFNVRDDHVRVRRSSVARAERRLGAQVAALRRGEIDATTLFESLRATFAHWSYADSWRLKERFLRRVGLWDDPLERVDPRPPEVR
jgi:RNA-directed DNA polymerase